MKKILAVALLTISAAVLAQTRADSFTASRISVNEVILTPLADGGCAARAGVSLTSDDGGMTLSAVTAQADLTKPAARTQCANFVDQLTPRGLAALRIANDGGVP